MALANRLKKKADLAVSNADILISGGGVVGCLAALALAKHTNFKIVLLEASQVKIVGKKDNSKGSSHAGFDARVIALASHSIDLLARLGVDITQILHHPIDRIHVSDRGHLGQVQLDANDYNVGALGKVVAIEALGEYLLAAIEEIKQIDILRPATIQKVARTQISNKITLSCVDHNNLPSVKQIDCKLLLISDGGQSKTRELLGFKTEQSDYKQTAIITNVLTQLPHKSTAYERFTSQGPIAFLPMHVNDKKAKAGHHMSVVWCIKKQNSAEKLALTQQDFLDELQSLFGHKLGRFLSCSKRFSYPLVLSQTHDYAQHRVFCIGNAAQSLHPIAGQGFNLGIRDVFALISALKGFDDPGSFECTQAYKALRKDDKSMTISATDTLVRVFSNQYLPMVIGRNLGLLGMNKMNPLKQAFAHLAMGVRSDIK